MGNERKYNNKKDNPSNTSELIMPRPRGRRAYTIIAEGEDGDIESQERESRDAVGPEEETELETSNNAEESIEEEFDDEDGNLIKVIVMDPAQNKFEIAVNPCWNISRFKKEGFAIHKIPSSQQRLIFMGRLLSDDTVLSDAKINKEGIIIH